MGSSPVTRFEWGLWHAPVGPSKTTGTQQPTLFGNEIESNARLAVQGMCWGWGDRSGRRLLFGVDWIGGMEKKDCDYLTHPNDLKHGKLLAKGGAETCLNPFWRAISAVCVQKRKSCFCRRNQKHDFPSSK